MPTKIKKAKTDTRMNPNDLIRLDIDEQRSKTVQRPYLADEMIQSYQNGLSKGFINGLKVALQLVAELRPTTSDVIYMRLDQFIEKSEKEQYNGKS